MRLLPSLLVLSLLSACISTPPSEFYILNSLYGAEANLGFSPNPKGLEVGFGPLDLPDYLDRPQIVTREGVNELTIDEFHRWGGELKSTVERIMAQNLSYLLDSERIWIYPWSANSRVRYQVRLDVLRMDGTLGKQALVRARWEILRGEGGETLDSRLSSRIEPVDGPGYRALVAAQSRALADISREIVTHLRQIEPEARAQMGR
jgi:uncharacterized lipoprotein YmbA